MKAQNIYNITMALMDEMLDSGEVDTNTTKDYLARTPGILTILQNEIALKLDRDSLDRLTSISSDVDLEDILCLSIIPYGLASRLYAQEDVTLSNYFSSLFEEKINNYINKYKDKNKTIKKKDVYNSTMRVGD